MQIIINIFLSLSIFLLVSKSFELIYLVTKIFHLAHAATITLGAFFTFYFFIQLNLPYWVAILLSITFCVLIGLGMEFFFFRYLRSRNSSTLLSLILSLGLYVILQNCISIVWGDDIKTIRLGDVKVGNAILGAYITDIQVITILISFILVMTVSLFLKYHKIGKNIRAVSVNYELAGIVGINAEKIILWSFGIGSGLAAVAGILVGSDNGLVPTMGFNILLYGIVTMVIGGTGNTRGLFCAALFLSAAQNLTAYFLNNNWVEAVTYLFLIVFLLLRPLGFSGNQIKKINI